MAVPAYLAASVGSPGRSGQVNQSLVSHPSDLVYTGSLQASQTTGASVYTSTHSLNLATSFTTGVSQTSVGQIWVQVSTIGGSPTSATITPLSVSVYANSGNLPTGSALATTTLNEQFVYSAPFWLQVPFSLSGLSPSTAYQIVVGAAGGSSNYYVWQHSNRTSGGSTSPDGVTWTAQTFGFMYQVYDQASSGPLQYIISDSGARWTQFTYDALGRISTIAENTTAQDGSNLYSTRTLNYTSGFLTAVN